MSWEEFRVGQRVLFRCDENDVWWCEGKITRVNHAASDTPNSYSIQQWNALCDPIPGSSDPPMMQPGQTFSRVPQRRMKIFPNERSYAEKLMEATYQTPPYNDPHAHLYMNQKTSTVIVNGKQMQRACIKIPLEELSDVVSDSDAICTILGHVKNRRKISGGASAANVDPVMLVHSMLPKNRNFDKDALREKAQDDSALMLQLADLTNYGLCRVPADFNKALTFYRCAAWGLSEEEAEKLSEQAVNYNFAYPMGQPEALCAAAGTLWDILGGESLYEQHPDAMIQAILYSPGTNGLAQIVVFFLGHAIRREWECPLAFQIGQALRDAQVLDYFLPGSFNLLQALECKIAREEESPPQFMEDLRMNQMSHDEYLSNRNESAELSEEDFLMFSKKATSIFLDLPVKILAPSGMVHSNIHVEYAHMTFPPYPLVVLIVNPLAEYIYNTVMLQGELEYIPYSPDTFKFIWDKIVFSLHRGVNGTKRFRPPLITFADRPGDRRLAEFIKSQIGSNSGTEIKVVRTNEYKVKQGQQRQYRALYDIMESIKEGIDSSMKQMIRIDNTEVRLPTQTNECIDIPIEELLLDVEGIKAEGNALFIQERFHPAQRCYSEAINKIQRSMNVDQRVKKMLGTILSNRAACFLKTSENMSPDTAKAVLMKAVDDCTVAKKFSNILPSGIVMKIERRRNDALKRIGGIKSQYSAWEELTSFNSTTEEQRGVSNQIVHPSGSRTRRRNNRTGRNRRRRGGRRRNQNRNQGSEVVENSDEEALAESVITTTTVILGKDLLESEVAEFITESEDPCPCCFERFRVELSDTHTTVLQCNHVCCLPCLADLHKKSRRNKDPIPFTCPICRFPIQENILENAVNPVLESATSIQDRLKILPLGDLDSENVARTLLTTKMFRIGDVLRALDAMLTDSFQATLRKDKHLSPEEKQTIYEECRRPIDILFSEIDQKRIEYNSLRDWESEDAKTLATRIEEIEQVLIPKAREKAMNVIWEKVNVGTMGHENEFGEVEVDFHAMHVDEAEKQFDQRVLPVLEALGSVLLIVGRGNHSEGHISKLKPALRRHIQTHQKKRSLCHEEVEGNDGAIRVKWIG